MTLSGGPTGDESPILAEEVQKKFDSIGDTIAAVQDAFNNRAGWRTIYDDVIDGTTDIPIEPGTYNMIRVSLYGGLDAGGEFIQMQVNALGTTNLHENAWTVWDHSTESVDDSDSGNGQVWVLAKWNQQAFNTASAIIMGTLAENILSFRGGGYQASVATGSRFETRSMGQLSEARLLSSLEIGGTSTAEPDNVHVVIEGHVPLT